MKTVSILIVLITVCVPYAGAENVSLATLNRSMKLLEDRDYVAVEVHRPDDTSVVILWYRDPRMTDAVCRRLSRRHDVVEVSACASRDTLIIATVGVSEATMDHEWCHVYGWAADHPEKKPAACETKRWRSFTQAMTAPENFASRAQKRERR